MHSLPPPVPPPDGPVEVKRGSKAALEDAAAAAAALGVTEEQLAALRGPSDADGDADAGAVAAAERPSGGGGGGGVRGSLTAKQARRARAAKRKIFEFQNDAVDNVLDYLAGRTHVVLEFAARRTS